MKKIRILDAFQIKVILIILMTLDHLHYLNNIISPNVISVFSVISRGVAPMFAFFAVEGIRHTGNVKKYCFRLFALAGIVFAGNTILNRIFSSAAEFQPINNNVIFTLAMGVLALAIIQWSKDKKRRTLYLILSANCFITGFLWGEWGTVLLPFMFIQYFFQKNVAYRIAGYILIQIIALLLPFSEPLYFLVFPFILLYNGRRGIKTDFGKYFFYFYYPIHLWIIYIIRYIG